MIDKKQRCPRAFVERKLKWLNDATPDTIEWLEDKSGPELEGCALLVRRHLGHSPAAPLGCTCGHWGRDIGYHSPACGLVEPEPAASSKPEPAASSKPKADAKPAASSKTKPKTASSTKPKRATSSKPKRASSSKKKTTSAKKRTPRARQSGKK